MVARAAQLQLFDSSNRERAEAISIDKKVVYPSRGLFLDRNGQLLLHNTQIYDLMVTYNRLDPKMDTLRFCQLLGIDMATFKKNITKNFKDKRFSRNVPFVFLQRLSPRVISRINEVMYEFPGFQVQVRSARYYPRNVGSSFLGYINEVTEKDIEKNRSVFEMGDYIGASGLERYYEAELRGQKGYEFLLQDNLGRSVGRYKEGKLDQLAVSGRDMVLGIDLELQVLAEELLNGKRGAVVAIDPKTGEILCIASAPTFDPNLLSIGKERGKNFARLANSPDKPLFDRSIMAQYPPGSIYKVIMGMIGLQMGVWNPANGVGCRGGYYIGGRRWGCHGHPYAGNLPAAIQYSCNTYFFTLFRRFIDTAPTHQVGLDSLNAFLYRFGLGAPLGVDLIGERRGGVPTSKFFDKIYPAARGGWRSPTIMSLGIGQGEIELTTIQMANLAAIVANKGWFRTPHLFKEFKDKKTPIPSVFRDIHYTGVAREHFEYAHQGMYQAVMGGTARIAQIPGIEVCGKTGTSQNPHGKDHSVFFAFAPRQDPKIAIAVFVENAGFGATYAAPISSLIIEQYLTGEVKREALKKRIVSTSVGLAKVEPTVSPQEAQKLPIVPAPKPAPKPKAPQLQPIAPESPKPVIKRR
jgi:penicillin-binding protein 2